MIHQPDTTWTEGVSLKKFPPLQGPREVDVVIIGGGITGITTAYLLTKAGKKVALIEQHALTSNATCRTTAFLTHFIDTSMAHLIPMFGMEKAQQVVNSHRDAIGFVEKIIQEEGISCDYGRCNNYVYATDAEEMEALKEEQEAGKKLGVHMDIKKDSVLPFQNVGYLLLKDQAKFHPLKYLSRVVEIITEKGCEIFENTPAVKIIHGETPTVVTPQGEITAKHVFVATYAPFDKTMHFKKAYYDSYVLEASIPKDLLPEGIYEDCQEPYHYFRVDKGTTHDRLVFGGEDHRSDVPVKNEKNFRALEEHMKELLEGKSYTITRKWEGPIMESIDGLAWIGKTKYDNVLYATAFSGNGMTYSMIAARLISDMILGKKNEYEELYRPTRIPTMKQFWYKGKDYMGKFIGGAIRNTFSY
jgi:glycine/D-amino acid oxidase-like deaminating enzyme